MGLSKHGVVFALGLALTVSAVCGSATADSPQTRSDIKGAALIPAQTLAHSPEDGSLDDYCDGYRAKTLTAVGRQVAKLKWIVTSEAPFGRYRVVTFASGFDTGTSGMCRARNANIAVFEGSNLVALAYTTRSAGWRLGVAEPIEGGALLVWGGDWVGPPIGELRQEGDSLRLTTIADERTFCHRHAVVPNVYGQSIDVARKTLIAHGWRPERPRQSPGPWSAAVDLAKHGIIEVADCAGTGVGYCAFNYRGAPGALSITTIGGDPEPANNRVVSYNVTCARN